MGAHNRKRIRRSVGAVDVRARRVPPERRQPRHGARRARGHRHEPVQPRPRRALPAAATAPGLPRTRLVPQRNDAHALQVPVGVQVGGPQGLGRALRRLLRRLHARRPRLALHRHTHLVPRRPQVVRRPARPQTARTHDPRARRQARPRRPRQAPALRHHHGGPARGPRRGHLPRRGRLRAADARRGLGPARDPGARHGAADHLHQLQRHGGLRHARDVVPHPHRRPRGARQGHGVRVPAREAVGAAQRASDAAPHAARVRAPRRGAGAWPQRATLHRRALQRRRGCLQSTRPSWCYRNYCGGPSCAQFLMAWVRKGDGDAQRRTVAGAKLFGSLFPILCLFVFCFLFLFNFHGAFI
eukprot:PhM_4_TR14077/c6_g3_i2/m.60810